MSGTWVEQAQMAEGYDPPSGSMNPNATVASDLDQMQLVEATEVRPGDTLILRFSRTLTVDDVERIKGLVKARLPGIEVVVVQSDGMAVYRPEDG